MKRRVWFTIAVGLQLVVLLVMIAMKMSVLAYGSNVLLRTVPVDPWDLFRGEYVILNYEISELDVLKISSESRQYNHNETVYVGLKQTEKYWEAVSISRRQPEEVLAIRGVVRSAYDNRVFVDYGIESFFVPEGQGREIENEMVNVDAEVSVDSRGNAALRRLFIKDKEITFR